MYCFQTTSSPPPQKKETVPEKKEEPKSVIESTEKSEVSRRDSVSYESKKDRPELKSSVMAKKSERKLYPEPQVERKVSVEAVKPVVEVIKEEVEEEVKVIFLPFIFQPLFSEVELVVVGPRTGGAAVEENENSGSGSSKVPTSFVNSFVIRVQTRSGEQGPPEEVWQGGEASGRRVPPHSPLGDGRLRLPLPQPLPGRRQEEGGHSRAAQVKTSKVRTS